MDGNVLRQIKALGGEGIISEADIGEFKESTQRVLGLMADGQWHSAIEIRLAAGENGKEASEGLRRMRELRRFFTIERQREGGSRLCSYRLVFRKPVYAGAHDAQPVPATDEARESLF